MRLGDHDGLLAIRREVHVVRIVDHHRLARLAGHRIDRRQAAVGAAFGVVGHPQRLQIPRRHHMLRAVADRKFVQHLEGGRIDDVDVIRTQIGHIDARQRSCHCGAEHVVAGVAVHVVGVRHRRHARNGGYRLRHRDRGDAQTNQRQRQRCDARRPKRSNFTANSCIRDR